MFLAEEYCHFEAGVQTPEGGFKRNFFLTLNDYTTFRQNHQNCSLYVTAYRYNNPNIRSSEMIGNLYIDFDTSDLRQDFDLLKEDVIRTIAAFKAIFGIGKDQLQLYFSGGKGFHLVIPCEVLGIQPHKELNNIFKLIAEDMAKMVRHDTVDTRIYDNVRLFRVPNSQHHKSKLFKVQMTVDELAKSTLDDVINLARQPRAPLYTDKSYCTQANRVYQSYVKAWEKEKQALETRRNKRKTTTLNFLPPCVQHILEEGATKGKRNNTVAVLASYFMQRGATEENAIGAVIQWNKAQNDNPLPEREVKMTVKSIFRSEHRYGCRALQEVSVCSSQCRLYSKDRERTTPNVI